MFHIAPGAQVFVLERLRKLDDVPVAVDEAVVPLRRAPELESMDFAVESLYAVLDRNGCAPMRAAYTVEAAAAAPREAKLLGLPAGAAVLIATTIGTDAAGQAVEVTRTAYPRRPLPLPGDAGATPMTAADPTGGRLWEVSASTMW